jgi:ABC-type transport system involved in multi-copper enzyme maturation permease subunit
MIASQRKWSPGELVLSAAVWVLVLAAVAREPVQNLFGPVFWYEMMRVGRRFTTFLLRFVYIGAVAALLALMYLEWWGNSSHGAGEGILLLYFGVAAVLLAFVCLAWWLSYRGVQRFNPVLYSGMVFGLLLFSGLAWWNDSSSEEVLSAHVQSQFASNFFYTFAVVQYVALLVVTPAYVAGAITDEKERKTIDYLFTTDLANREIVFGKLAARVATVILFVLAGLPLIAFLQMFGGIDPDLVLANTEGALITVVGLSTVAIAISAAAKRSRDAILIAYGLLLLYLATSLILPLIMAMLAAWGYTTFTVIDVRIDLMDVTNWYSVGNAFFSVPQMTNFGRNFDPDIVIRWLGRYTTFWTVVSMVSLGWAVTRLRAVAMHQRYGGERLTKKGAAKKAVRTLRPVGQQPLVWKEVFVADRGNKVFGILFRIAILFLLLSIPIFGAYQVFFAPWAMQRTFAQQWEDFTEGMNFWVRMWTGILAFFIFIGTALRAASAVAGEKDRDTWVSLCTTPITVGEFLYAKWLGAMLSMRFALGTLVFVWVVGVLLGSSYIFMIPVTAVFLFVFNSAFALAGIWCSITARTALIANMRAFFVSVVMAGGFWTALGMCCGIPLEMSRVHFTVIENLVVMALGATPPIVTGLLPIGSFDDRETGPGPFHPGNNEIGLCAPVFGLWLWSVINLILYIRVRIGLSSEMNRERVGAAKLQAH